MRLGRLAQQVSDEEEINLAPLIDVVFILLIFFVVTTTFSKELGLDIDRPKAASGKPQSASIVRVAVSPQGELTVNARPTSPWRVEQEVREAMASLRDKQALVVSDQAVEAGQLVRLVDACKRAGAQNVAIAVQQKDAH